MQALNNQKNGKEFEYRDLSDGNVKIISNFLRQIDWTYLNNLDANEAYSDLIEKLSMHFIKQINDEICFLLA